MTTLALRGHVDRDIAALFLEQLAGLGRDDAPVILNMQEAEIEDAVMPVLVEFIRQAATRAGSVQLLRAPENLAQCLHRVGVLPEGSSIQLIELRSL